MSIHAKQAALISAPRVGIRVELIYFLRIHRALHTAITRLSHASAAEKHLRVLYRAEEEG